MNKVGQTGAKCRSFHLPILKKLRINITLRFLHGDVSYSSVYSLPGYIQINVVKNVENVDHFLRQFTPRAGVGDFMKYQFSFFLS